MEARRCDFPPALLPDLQVGSPGQGFLGTNPELFLLPLSHRRPWECFGGTRHGEEAVAVFGEFKPETYLPDVSDMAEPRGPQLRGPSGIFQLSQETGASLCLPGIETQLQTETFWAESLGFKF